MGFTDLASAGKLVVFSFSVYNVLFVSVVVVVVAVVAVFVLGSDFGGSCRWRCCCWWWC